MTYTRVPPFTITITRQEAIRIIELLEGDGLGGRFSDRNLAEFIKLNYEKAEETQDV